ncbi:hypothetical protein [Sphingomonas sp. NFX23]|uniref:hypothetical protein n=1 Tax=Sphingomonas sp. NFX23 TaxID=2819532 RepID=UPI003CF32808
MTVTTPDTITSGGAYPVAMAADIGDSGGKVMMLASERTMLATVTRLDPVKYARSGWIEARVGVGGKVIAGTKRNPLAVIASQIDAGGQPVVFLDANKYGRSGWLDARVGVGGKIKSGTRRVPLPAPAVVASALNAGGQSVVFLDATKYARSGWLDARVGVGNKIKSGTRRVAAVVAVPVTAIDTLYEVAELTDGAGKQQTYLTQRATGKLTQLSPAGSNNVPRGAIRSDGWAVYKSDRANPAPGGLYARKVTGEIAAPEAQVFASRELIAIGNSLTYLGFGGTTFWEAAAAALGWPARGYGISGQTSAQIAQRLGGKALNVTLTADTLPATGSVIVTAINGNPLTGQVHIKLHGRLGLSGPYATLARDGNEDASSNYILTQDAGGANATIAPGTRFYPDGANLNQNSSTNQPYNRSAVHVLWMGRNGITLFDDNIANTRSVIELQATMVKRFVVIAELPFNAVNDPIAANAYAEGAGTSGRSVLDAYNARLIALWPDNVFDPLPALLAAGDGSAGDNADIANRMTPRSLRRNDDGTYDYGHPNAAGRAVIGAALATFIDQKGWKL